MGDAPETREEGAQFRDVLPENHPLAIWEFSGDVAEPFQPNPCMPDQGTPPMYESVHQASKVL